MELENIEQVPVQQVQLPPVEEIVRQAGFGVQKFETPMGIVTIVQFVSPFKIYTFQLDDAAAERLSEDVKPSRVIRADATDLSRLAP